MNLKLTTFLGKDGILDGILMKIPWSGGLKVNWFPKKHKFFDITLPVGIIVGEILGTRDGLFEGTNVGFIDGMWVGFREGTSVGCTVGTVEGEEVGLAVGLSHTFIRL